MTHITLNSEITLCFKKTDELLALTPSNDGYVIVNESARICKKCEKSFEQHHGTLIRESN